MDRLYLLHEAIGASCVLLMVYCNVQKDDRLLLRLGTLGTLVWVVNFGLIGAWTASATTALSALRYHLAARGKSRRLFILFFILHLLAGVLTYHDAKDVFAVAATLVGTAAVFLCRGGTMRALFLGACLLWFTHNTLAGSASGATLDLIGASLHLYTLRRLQREVRSTRTA